MHLRVETKATYSVRRYSSKPFLGSLSRKRLAKLTGEMSKIDYDRGLEPNSAAGVR